MLIDDRQGFQRAGMQRVREVHDLVERVSRRIEASVLPFNLGNIPQGASKQILRDVGIDALPEQMERFVAPAAFEKPSA